MNKVFAIIGILSGIGFGVLGVMFGEFLPQAKIPFIIFGAILTLGGVAILFWNKIAGEPEKLPEEEITITAAKDSPTGQATVRIPLDGLEKPVQGKRCYVEATAEGMQILDSENALLTQISAGEAITRIHFPSFWGKPTLLVDWESEDPLVFEPKKEAIAQLRDLIEISLKMHPEAAREAIKKKALFYLGLGGLSLALGIGITLFSFNMAGPNGRYFVMTGFLGFGIFSILRGILWYTKLSKVTAAQKSVEE
ncbi:hypothetical protein KIH39_24030 [Telmatocola sphagniphila]|uniref:Uncharacterized protein n=1 Tax=Telmatocola sphagniphila TaxID=1123043 RepID=A0A8E6B5X3_9BACT|nr:hypothetical protein [Telmatocola sphagniphila]QVL31869.1 hypothetical protein KIH39_24030 [Telmatocola sphagniphila]